MAIIDRAAKDLKTVCLDDSRYLPREQQDSSTTGGGAISYEHSVAASYEDEYEPLRDARETMHNYFPPQFSAEGIGFEQREFWTGRDKEEGQGQGQWAWEEGMYGEQVEHGGADGGHGMG